MFFTTWFARQEKMKRSNKKRTKRTQLIGIPITLVAVLICLFIAYYSPEYEKPRYGELIYSSDRYKASAIPDWHKIDLSSFSVEVPKDYYFYLDQGFHGGKVGGITNSKDTIGFVHGGYHFDACEGMIIGEVTGTCDTLKVFNLGSTNLVVAMTDSYIGAFSKGPKEGLVFKAWADLDMDKSFLFKVFNTIEIKD